uniref:Dystonin n=1 Tax=Cyprinus carpio TaxID=7962 RepID=A0A8C1VJ46_CYPCA
MSSSADFSDDEEYSVKSGSVSPAPGDTLPWNLPRHERSKRKIQGGSVLDPAERAVLRIADERDRVQKKTFTKWINQHLLKVRKHVNDLYEDLRDGHNLISLLEVLSGETLPREKGRMRFHRLQNVQIALDYLKRRQVKLVNIRNDDITDGNPKLTLGLIWTIILHFQISDVHVTGESEDMTAKERLLLWSQQMTEGYVGVRCDNFTTSWRDGRLFNAIIHKYRPDLVDMSKVSTQSSRSNLEQAFGVAEQLGVARLLDPEDVDVSSPDEKSVITYVSTLYDVFPKVPEGMEGISANDVDVKWVEYQNMVKYLSQWIKHNVTVMTDRNFPSNPVELKALYTQYLQFKENEIPLKENEKAKIKHLYKMLEAWIEFGRIQLPQGYHPNDVEKEWGKLIVAMLEREKSLRPEVDRLEMLQQIANRVQRDCVAGEDKLALARTALQSDAKRLESGIQFQNEAEIAGYLLECENLLRQQVVDIQLLLDGKFYLADQVSKLRDDLLALRTECSTVYSKGHMLTSEQTKMMISGITQSLNSNFSQNFSGGLSPALTQGGLVTSGGSPAMSPATTCLMLFVESNLGNHKDFHKAIEEFQMSIKEAKMSEIQMTQPLKQSYSEKLNKLESQYRRLLKCSSERQKHLDSLYDFVSRATQELIWLNEKEEEEVAFDWSERNSNISRKRDYHADLMRELDDKEEVIKSVQEKAESLLLENHPARLTIEAYRAAMQTQWSWILQLCHCVEQHLKENAVYFDFFSEAKESLDYLKSLQDAIHRKYSCDRSSSLHRLEDLIQESMDEKEQLLKYSSTVGGLVGRAKSVVQLKARNPENPIRTSIPVKAICDYRQIEITISKEDECVLVSNSHRAKWKVISPSGNEAMVPSVCFSVPPPNKEATEMASRIEQLYQNVLALWHHSHINMKSVVSWHYLMTDIRTLLPGDHEQVLSSLQSHFEDFLRDSDESEVFTVADCAQLEKEVLACKEYYEELLKSAEREEHEESMYNLFISEVRNFRMRVEGHEEQLIRKIRTPLDRDDLQECVLRITEQEKKVELDRLKDDLESLREKCEVFLRQAAASPSVPMLSSELNILTQSTNQVYSMCCIYLEKLKTVSLVVKHSQSAEALVKLYEAKLCEEDTINANIKSIDGVMSTLKVKKSHCNFENDDELQKARVVSERMFKMHNERDFDLDWHKEKADQLKERWQNIHSQIENRSLSISKSLKYYKDTYNSLDEWITEMEAKQLKAQENQPEDSKALAEFLNQQKVLVTEIEQKQSKIEECQKYSEQYAVGVKDYELQLMTYRAMVDSQHKSPMKRRKMQSSSDVIQQEFMDLRTRYTALVTLMTQYVKFAGEKLKRVEEDEESRLTLEHERKLKERSHTVETAERDNKHLSQEVEKLKTLTSNATKAKQEAEEQLCNVRTQLDESVRQRGILDLELLKAKSKISELETEKIRVKSSIFQLDNIHKDSANEISRFKHMLKETEQKLDITEREARSLKEQIVSYIMFQAMEERLLDRHRGKALIETQIATGGLIHPLIGIRVPMDLYLLPFESEWQEITVMDSSRNLLHILTDHKSGRQLCIENALSLKILQMEELNSYRSGQFSISELADLLISRRVVFKVPNSPVAGLWDVSLKKRLSVFKGHQQNLVDRLTALRLLEAQACTGGICDPASGERVLIKEAQHRGLLDEGFARQLQQCEQAYYGIIHPQNGKTLTVAQAMQENLFPKDVGVKCLEFQLATGGLINSESLERVSLEDAIQNCLIDKATAAHLQHDNSHWKCITCPKTKRKMSLKEALEKSVFDSHTGFVLLEATKPHSLLNWMKTNPNKDGKAQSDGKPSTEGTSKPQVNKTNYLIVFSLFCSTVCLIIFITKTVMKIYLVIMFERTFRNILISLISLQALKVIQGILDVESGAVMSVCYSVNNGFIDQNTGLGLLEAQLITTGLIWPEQHLHMDLEEAFKHKLVDDTVRKQLQELNETKKCLQDLQFALEPLPVMAALEKGAISEQTAMKIIEIQLATGGLRLSYTGDILHLEGAFQLGLIPQSLFIQILERKDTWKNLIDPNTAEKVSLTTASMVANPECHDASKDQEKHLKHSPLLSSETTSYTEMPSEFPHTDVVWDDKLERDYAMHLLRAQVEEGGILDVTSGKRYDLEAALGKGLIDEETVLEVLALQLQEDGLKESENTALSVLNISVSKGCISSKVALQIMEKQNLLGGFYDAAVGRTISICDALETGMITDDISRSVLSSEAIRKSIIDPGGKCVLGVYDANKSGMLDDKEAERMLHSQRNEREDIRVPDLAKRGQISLTSDEATQVFTDIACVSSKKDLSGTRQLLEDSAFDIQNFISEHAQFLSPTHSRYLLRALSTTQRSYKELMDRVFTQRQTLEVQLEIHEEETQQKALQKDLQANASALNEVISSTKKFLEENRSKLAPEQISALENKLEELKTLNPPSPQVHHQEILSQQQDLIIATQSAQALLDKQAQVLSPAEKDKLQRDIKELKARYEASLTQAEQQMKQVQTVQEELQKFKGDCEEFETWLQQAHGEMEELGAPAAGLDTLSNNLQRQKSFSEDVISHKGDLRFITISGQKVLDAAKACDCSESGGAVKERLDSAASHYKALHTQVIFLFTVFMHNTHYDFGKKNFNKFLFVDDIIERYDNLSKSVSDRNEKLQVTLTRSLSVQDGLDEMMSWMEKVEESVKETPKALEQDMFSRQSSILAMKAKVKTFVESAEPAAAALLQAKMEGLSQRFTDASEQHKQKVAQIEDLRDKVEQFEKTSEKVQQFVLKSSQALSESDGPGKNVAELSQLVQVYYSLTKHHCTVPKPSELHILIGVYGFGSCQLGLLDDWTSKAPAVQDINSKGSALCSLISVLTSPAKAKIRRNSGIAQEYFKISHLMLVQQNMSYINNNYEHLGELLKARSSELGALLKRVLGVHEQAESLRQWMEDTKKTATSLSNRPSGKDTVKSQIEQQKVFEDNMKQKQVQLQQLRENLLRLIEEHPDSPEAEKWKHMLEVRGTMEVRKQHLEESSRMLELFQTTQPQLSQWLQEKELMMGVLGPLSVDPNMLNTQKQQVQILLKEFDSRKPQYEKLTEAATAIASASEQQDPAVEQVKEQLASVSQKWQALTGQLSQRHALIEQVVGKTTQFQELLRSLSKSATCLETELNNQQALSTQPDEVKKQIEATNAILAQLREEKKRLTEAESVCSELSAMVTEEYLRADLTKQLESTTKPFRQLEDKAGKRIEQLNSAFASSQQFHQTSKDFQAWLNQTLQEQCKPQPISANAEKLKQSLKENSAVQKAISEHEELYNTIIKEGEALLQSTEGAEKVALQGQLSALKSSWHDVKKGNAEQAEKIQGALERALKYKEHYENLSSWVQEVEDREKNVKLSANSVEIEGSLSQLKAIQKDVEKHRGQVVMMNAAVDSLLEVVTSDGDSVREEKVAIGKRVDKLTEDLTLKRESLENISQKLKEFNDLQKEAKGQLEAARKQLDSHSALGVQAYSNKNLTNMKAQQNSLEGVHNQVEHLKNVAKSLVVDASDVEGVTDLLLQADSLEKDHMSITKKVEDACSTLENKLQGIGQFQNSIREMFANFTDLDDEFDGMAPVGRDLDTLRDQQSTIKEFVARLQDLMTNTANGRDRCKKMLESEASPDLLGLKRDLETLGKQCGKLMDRATGRREQVEETLSHLEEFYSKAQEFSHNLSIAEKQEESQGPVGLETEVINQQLESFKVFHKDVIESLQSQLQELNTLGQALIQNAAKGTSTKKLDHDLEEVNTRWNTLNKKVAERSAQLHEALLHCGRFQDALESLLSWLTDTEELVANQKAPSAEFKVVKAQIQEQKLLQRLLDDRRATVELIKTEGRKVTNLADTVDKEKIAKEIECLGQRWDALLKKAESRQKQLENILVVAQQFHETLVPLTEWLTATEKRLANSEPIGTQTSKIEEQISQHKALHEDIELRKQNIEQAILNGLELLKQTTGDEVVVIQGKLDGIKTRYSEINTMSNNVSKTLDKALSLATKLQNTHEELNSWLEKVESELATFTAQEPVGEQLTHLQERQKTLMKEVKDQKPLVDSLNEVSSALLELVPWRAREGLDRMVTDDNERYKMASDAITQHVDQTGAAILKSQQVRWFSAAWENNTTLLLGRFPVKFVEAHNEAPVIAQMRELIAEHKPHIDKMNKTGPQLVELSPTEGVPIREKYEAAEKLYSQLKVDVKHRAAALDEAISKSTQFHDKIDPMLESLERIAERLRQPPSISVEVEKIREQISENKAVNVDLEKLQPSYETLKQRGEEMIARSEGADKDLSAKAVQDKLDQMVFLWNDIQALLEEREAKLLDVMDLAEKFWCDHCALIVTIKDTHDLLKELEEPGVDPSVVKQQQESVEGFREEIDGLQEELNVVQNLGAELMTACGEPDKPVIKKSIDEVNSAWETLNKAWKERVETLEEAMQAAVQFQDSLQNMFDSVDIMEGKLDLMSPVGTDLETVKQQIEELKVFKADAYQLQIEMERLNHQAGLLLKKVLEEAERTSILEPMNELKMLWDSLDKKIINRQHKLEGALLALGQFQHALDELLAWLTHTEELLNEQRKACGDPKAIEIELAKHHVLQNDVLAHKTTVEAVNKAGSDLIDSSAGEEARGLQNKLENLNQRWRTILEKTEQRRQLLDSALLQAQGFHGEIEDMQQWLKDTERQLLASKALGGLPDTAREQLNTHLELCSTLEAKEEIYKQLLDRGQQILTLTPEGQDSTTELDLRNLQEKWECVQAKVTERKVKLEEALAMATDFHNSLQDFINWLTQAEQTLTMVSPASLILETVMFQIDEHKVFVTEVNSHRDQIIELDKTGTHLKYFSQKQDVVLIKNLLLSVQGRWEKVVQRSVERGRLLDDARKRAKQFHETWNKLMEWLEESERALDSELEIANDPDKIKTQLTQHKEFQKTLGSKHSVYDTTSRTGRALKDKTSLQDDNQKLDDMLSELRDKWDTVCGKSVERQNKLEEALLFSGQFTDALQALIDWLYKVEPQLAEDQPVHGDIDLVLNLIDSHKVFQKELGKRTGSVQALKRSARELIENSHDDSSWVKVQMQELSTRWETVCSLSVSKQTRLEQALCQAEEFHSTVHILLEWLAEAEQSLRFHGALPDDEEALRALIEQHKEFMKKLEEKRLALNKATSMGEAILSICHPDSITTIKHWNTIIKARFEEVTAWVRQHQQRLSSALAELLATQELLENLLNWLQWAETTLGEKDKEPLPQELEEVKSLIAEHQTFMEEMTRKQPDVDKITKTHKRKSTRFPTQSMYTAASQTQIETKNPRVNLLVSKWQQVWLLALDRRRKLNDALDRLEELKEFANFDFDVWRKRYMRWMNHKKSRVMDFFRRIDKDQDGKVTRQEFIDGILSSKFPTSRLEMSAVADIFDRDGDGYIDYYEFVAALHPNKDAYKPLTDADKIEDEVTRQVAKCKCPKRFQVEQIGANKYRFGDSQQLRLVRILRSTVMVRVGGGWMALDEFLVKNDPCRAKGRTNVELREKFILPEGTTQVMASFRYRGRRSRPSSRGASPNRSNSSHSCPTAQPNPPGSNTPKVWILLIRFLIYKGLGKISSRPGSKAGSRGSSRRGSDASDFDISDIQSVCSDVSETVTDSGRPTPRSASRQHGGKPSKIPTPQRRSTPTSKLAKTTKR